MNDDEAGMRQRQNEGKYCSLSEGACDCTPSRGSVADRKVAAWGYDHTNQLIHHQKSPNVEKLCSLLSQALESI